MSIVWRDGFDHYGSTPNGGRDAMLAGPWAGFAAGNGTLPYISNVRARTGTYALRFDHNPLATEGTTARRVFEGNGSGMGLYFESLPTTNGLHGVELRDVANNPLIKFAVQSNGAIGVYYGSGATVLIGASDPILTAQAWNHFEFRVLIDNVVGEVECQINGEQILMLDDLNLGTTEIGQIAFGSFDNTGDALTWYLDDLVAWDTEGSTNNTFMSGARVTTVFCDATLSPIDWTVVGAVTAHEAIDEVPADGDTSYITAPDAGDVVELGIPTLASDVSDILDVYITPMARLSDIGSGSIQISIVSNGDVSAGPEIALTSAYTYWDGGGHPVDPDTGVAWTKEGLETAIVRIERTL